MGFKYVVLGAGRQGVAAAYDLAKFDGTASITLADLDLASAQLALARIRKLLAKEDGAQKFILKAVQADAGNEKQLKKALKGRHVVLSALPYYLNEAAAKTALACRVHYCDLGGEARATRNILKLDAAARNAGVALVPDCGLAPGLSNTLAAAGIEQMEICQSVKIYCGGLPKHPKPPLGYKLVYSLEGLLESYFGAAYVVSKGAVKKIESFSGLESVVIDPLGQLEAFFTAGGSSTAPWTFQNRLWGYQYKTLRYPGHYERMKLIREMGLLDRRPINVNGGSVVPRDFFIRHASAVLKFPDDEDIVVLRVAVCGKNNTRNVEVVYDLLEYADPETGFSAMERTTGYAAALVAKMLAAGAVKGNGAATMDCALWPRRFLDEIRQKGFRVTETIRKKISHH